MQEKKNNDNIVYYFEFIRNLVFTNSPTVMLNIEGSSIKKGVEQKNTNVHQQIQTLIVKTDHLALKNSLKLGSQK